MNTDRIVSQYITAWNRRDVPGLLDLMHTGAAYYDAFWMETCVGNLAQYFHDAMDEEPYWYEQVGDVIPSDSGVVFRYSAHECSDSKIGEPLHYGAEVLHFRGDKILTVADFYCSSDRGSLEEVARLAAMRHGVPNHVNAGLGALRALRVKAELSSEIEQGNVYLDPDITMLDLAEKIGCSIDQLSIVIDRQFGTSFGNVMDTQRTEHARALLQKYPDDPNIIERVATLAGFKSVQEFRNKFTDFFGVTPPDFCRRQKQGNDSNGK